MQAIIEEQETTNEELKAANEEVLSNNEELQSTNEELETAKEELQSTNEELVTLSEQQASRNTELNLVNDDLRNVLEGIKIPILMLDNERRIRRFTPSAEKLFNLLPSDIGRPIQNLRPNLDLADLHPLISRTMDTLTIQEEEVRDLKGHHYSMTVRPYRTSDNKVDGVLIALADIDALKRSLEEANQARRLCQLHRGDSAGIARRIGFQPAGSHRESCLSMSYFKYRQVRSRHEAFWISPETPRNRRAAQAARRDAYRKERDE